MPSSIACDLAPHHDEAPMLTGERNDLSGCPPPEFDVLESLQLLLQLGDLVLPFRNTPFQNWHQRI